jgi:hypothetical protein
MSSDRRKSGIPVFAESQRAEILEMLRAAGPAGVSKSELIFAKHWTQCAARIWELEHLGYKISHIQRPCDRFVRYVLESEPLQPTPSTNPDWYEHVHGPRPKPGHEGSNLPLFDTAVTSE